MTPEGPHVVTPAAGGFALHPRSRRRLFHLPRREEHTMSAAWRVLSLALAFAVLTNAVRAADDDPTKPLPRKDNVVWMERHAALLERAKKGADVVFLGDSLTQGWEGPDGAEAWKKQFEPLKAANFGAGGDRTQHVLWRVGEGKELHDLKPKVIVLQVGGGNLASNSADEVIEGITAVVTELGRQKPGSRVLLLGLLPRGAKADDKFRDKIKAINQGLAKLDDGKKVRYLDAGAKFLAKDGDLSDELMPDGLHPSARGYAAWAEAIKGPLEEMLR
jgi:lysophospholipase L1-like esterase